MLRYRRCVAWPLVVFGQRPRQAVLPDRRKGSRSAWTGGLTMTNRLLTTAALLIALIMPAAADQQYYRELAEAKKSADTPS
jgi:hypothetical protein